MDQSFSSVPGLINVPILFCLVPQFSQHSYPTPLYYNVNAPITNSMVRSMFLACSVVLLQMFLACSVVLLQMFLACSVVLLQCSWSVPWRCHKCSRPTSWFNQFFYSSAWFNRPSLSCLKGGKSMSSILFYGLIHFPIDLIHWSKPVP